MIAKKLASLGSRTNAFLQVLALLTVVLVCPFLVKSKGGDFRATLPDRGGVFAVFGIDHSETRT